MRHVRFLAIALMMAGCASPLRPSDGSADIDFIRGCWVDKSWGKRLVIFLRLLPPSPGAATLEGALLLQSTDPQLPVTNPERERFVFARDGSWATLDFGLITDKTTTNTFHRATDSWVQLPPGAAVFTNRESPALYLIVAADGEWLSMTTTRGPEAGSQLFEEHLVFRAQRDGCD
jgi:hypothetical protein